MEIHPNDVASAGRLGRLHLRHGNYTSALAYYGSIINKKPKLFHEFAYFDVGFIYWRSGGTYLPSHRFGSTAIIRDGSCFTLLVLVGLC